LRAFAYETFEGEAELLSGIAAAGGEAKTASVAAARAAVPKRTKGA
jgi:hypothetical protein